MKVEIITIGDELLIGHTADTNAQWMARFLSDQGHRVQRITSLPDRPEAIVGELAAAQKRSSAVLVTGGLGPTRDDVTRRAIGQFFNVPWQMNDQVYRRLETYLAERGYGVSRLNREQAKTPKGARVFINQVGTAPGLGLEKDGCRYYFMPGVPAEMRDLMEKAVSGALNPPDGDECYRYQIVVTQGVPEAHLAQELKDYEENLPDQLDLAYLPGSGLVRIRLSGRGNDEGYLLQLLNEKLTELEALASPYIVHIGEEPLEQLIGQKLAGLDRTLATAESCTGGSIAQRITSVPGSSRYFKGSAIAYSNGIKMRLLGVAETTLDKYGAVSRQVVEEMARGALDLFQVEYAVAVSGIAGPTGGTTTKSVGTTWIAVASEKGVVARWFVFGKDRVLNIEKATNTALVLLKRRIWEEI
jgi:nicotinamide-nucleotide amidase